MAWLPPRAPFPLAHAGEVSLTLQDVSVCARFPVPGIPSSSCDAAGPRRIPLGASRYSMFPKNPSPRGTPVLKAAKWPINATSKTFCDTVLRCMLFGTNNPGLSRPNLSMGEKRCVCKGENKKNGLSRDVMVRGKGKLKSGLGYNMVE